MIKRLCDIIFSLVGLIITAPFLLALILAIRLGSQGPAFYRGLRVGKNGKNFYLTNITTYQLIITIKLAPYFWKPKSRKEPTKPFAPVTNTVFSLKSIAFSVLDLNCN